MNDSLMIICVVLASIIVGKWFVVESNKIKAQGKPLYKIYLTIPGLLIILSLTALVVMKKIGLI